MLNSMSHGLADQMLTGKVGGKRPFYELHPNKRRNILCSAKLYKRF